MNLEKFTDRAKGFLQSAQTVAIRMNHQRISARTSAQGAARGRSGHGRRADRRGGRRRRSARRRRSTPRWPRSPRCRAAARSRRRASTMMRCACSIQAEQIATKAGDSYVTVERLLLALTLASTTAAGKALAAAGVKPDALNAAINQIRAGPHRRHGGRRRPLRRAQEIRARPDPGGARRQARSGDRPRRGDPPHHPDPRAPHQEQSGADRRARRRQDRDRRGPRAAHRQWRRARHASRTGG